MEPPLTCSDCGGRVGQLTNGLCHQCKDPGEGYCMSPPWHTIRYLAERLATLDRKLTRVLELLEGREP